MRNAREFLKLLGFFLIVLSFFGTIAGCNVWKWKECRKVGHGYVYCAAVIS